MPRIHREQVTAYAHCGQQLDEHGELAFDANGSPSGEERCPGYRQVPVQAIREVIEWTFGDLNQGSTDPTDAALAHNVSHSHERLQWLDLADMPCPYCSVDRELSDQVRPVYSQLGGLRAGADQLFQDRRMRREQGEAVKAQADAATRQADALEEANRLKARELDLKERELDALAPKRRPSKVEA